MNYESEIREQEILKEIGNLEAKGEELDEAVVTCAEQEEEALGFVRLIGKIVRELLGL